MPNPNYSDARKILAYVESEATNFAVQLNAVNPADGGRGMRPEEIHVAIATLAAGVHNVAFALNKILDTSRGDRPRQRLRIGRHREAVLG